ncbi:hypothetical protein QEJ31_11190 [Pigmentibacter sp. JX0631]|uniref:hypothetical protein n=1 Tax=Pigmentibacter sp. JX0631 TaxID=2976982 RepID=UPI002468470C|nr:hypothetical protein [Pigmentibacter sp. JX0631]WGL59084.1 hypothetical protein QEJ31_11190 [Pigmentibacter sp. JX0631]
MQSLDQDVLIRDVLLFIAALIGLVYILIVHFKESRFHFKYLGKLNKDNNDYDFSKLEWFGQFASFYSLTFDEPHVIWEINMFSIRMIKKDKKFSSFAGFSWFEFSKSQSTTEKIMAPILRKIFLKYRLKFEKIHPIKVVRVPKDSVHLYTWLQNETHTTTAIFNFLDEALYISSESKVYPSLTIVWDDIISIEVILPNSVNINNLDKKFEKIIGVEYTKTESTIHLKLWVAFSIEKIPLSLKEKEKKLGNLTSYYKVS